MRYVLIAVMLAGCVGEDDAGNDASTAGWCSADPVAAHVGSRPVSELWCSANLDCPDWDWKWADHIDFVGMDADPCEPSITYDREGTLTSFDLEAQGTADDGSRRWHHSAEITGAWMGGPVATFRVNATVYTTAVSTIAEVSPVSPSGFPDFTWRMTAY